MDEITSMKRFQRILNKYRYVFVDVYAEWCGPCKRIAPQIEELANEHKDIKFIKINCDTLPDLAKSLEVSSLPTFILFNKGMIIEKVKGANIEKVKELLDHSRVSSVF